MTPDDTLALLHSQATLRGLRLVDLARDRGWVKLRFERADTGLAGAYASVSVGLEALHFMNDRAKQLWVAEALQQIEFQLSPSEAA